MATFPIAINPNRDSYSEATSSAVLRTQMEGGPIKQSLRYSKQYINRNLVYHFTDAQMATFRTFFTTTINRGVDSFDWPDPLDSDTLKDSRIVNGEWSVVQLAADVNRVSFTLEILE